MIGPRYNVLNSAPRTDAHKKPLISMGMYSDHFGAAVVAHAIFGGAGKLVTYVHNLLLVCRIVTFPTGCRCQ